MNPITIRIYDPNSNRIVTRFLDMCSSVGATAEGIYSVMDKKLTELLEDPNPWRLCTSFGVDNKSVNIGIRESIKAKVRNLSVYLTLPYTSIVLRINGKVVCAQLLS